MNQKSSLPPQKKRSIQIDAAFWNTFRIFKHKLSLSLIVIMVISFSFWLYASDSLHGALEFVVYVVLTIPVIGLIIFLFSLPNLRIRKKFLHYKIRRHRLLKQYYKEPFEHEKINEVIDYYQQQLRELDAKVHEEFGLGI
jgi:hypothetical protein